MRLERYITEAKNWEDVIWEKIERDCKPWLRLIKSNNILLRKPFLRGMRKNGITDKKFRVRKDRRPKDMPHSLYKAMNEWSKERFGWNIRREGVFCTTNDYEAGRYGDIYMIFPIGPIEYVWADVKDTYQNYDKTMVEMIAWRYHEKEFVAAKKSLGVDDANAKDYDWALIQDFMDWLTFETPSNSSVNFDKRPKLKDLRKNIMVSVMEHGFKYKDTDIEEAADNGSEVIINCDEYYAVLRSSFAGYYEDKMGVQY